MIWFASWSLWLCLNFYQLWAVLVACGGKGPSLERRLAYYSCWLLIDWFLLKIIEAFESLAFVDSIFFDDLVLIGASVFLFLAAFRVRSWSVHVPLLFLYVIFTLNLPFSCCLICSPWNFLRLFFKYVNLVALVYSNFALFNLSIFFNLADEMISAHFFHFGCRFLNQWNWRV